MFLLSLQLPPPPTATRVFRFLGKSKKHGFTLAEVLITMGIIGIIAAMTVPTLSTKIQKHMWEVKAKRAYSLLSNRTKIVLNEKGCEDISCAYNTPTSTYSNDEGKFVISYAKAEDITKEFITDLFPDAERVQLATVTKNMYDISGKKGGTNTSYAYKIPKANILISFGVLDFTNYWILMPDSHMNPELRTRIQRTHCNIITEFPAKKYIRGRNLFSIVLTEDGSWIPYASYDLYKERCNPTASSTTEGDSCLSRLMKNSWKMDY